MHTHAHTKKAHTHCSLVNGLYKPTRNVNPQHGQIASLCNLIQKAAKFI